MRKTNMIDPINPPFLQTAVSGGCGSLKKIVMTEKQKYIGGYLDGYFSDKKVPFGMQYYSMLENAITQAEKKWKN